MISDKNLSVCYRRYTGRCPCQGCVERTCLVWCTLQILGETCHTSFENVFESSIKHIHKKLCRHQFILAGICCLLLLWLWGTGLAEDREGSGNTFPPPMSLWSRGIFFFSARWEVIWTACLTCESSGILKTLAKPLWVFFPFNGELPLLGESQRDREKDRQSCQLLLDPNGKSFQIIVNEASKTKICCLTIWYFWSNSDKSLLR